MPLSDIAKITITTQVGGLTQTGFGLPNILGYTATWVERTRLYDSMDGVALDFATTTPEWRAASAVFSQNPRPPQLMISRGALKPTQQYDIKFTVANSRKYGVKLNGVEFDFTSDPTATSTEISAGIQAAVAAAATAAGFTASVQGTSPNEFVRILANTPGNWCGVEVVDVAVLALYQNHADPGVATDLAAVNLENGDWYHLITLFNSSAYISNAAGWVESANKLYTPDSADTEIITVALATPSTDIATVLKAASYARTGLIFHRTTWEFAGAALPGVCLPNAPGSETWMFKTLAGITSDSLTPTHIANLIAKRANYYYTIAGRAITAQGMVASAASAFLDIVRLRDWLMVRMQERLFLVLANSKKVAYTDQGVTILEGEVRAQLQEGVLVGGIAEGYTVTAGKVSLQNPVDKANRLYKGLSFFATLQGAIHTLDITGVLAL